MDVRLLIECDDRLAAKARYVFATFAKVLGVTLIDGREAPSTFEGVSVWYGYPGREQPSLPGLVSIVAAPDAAACFVGRMSVDAQNVGWISWQGERIPILFGMGGRSGRQRPLDVLALDGSCGLHIPFDFIASAFYFLSCWEETVIADRDSHGRFPYVRSLASRLQLGKKNVVDLYLELFRNLLNCARCQGGPDLEIPLWAGDKPFVVCLSHDVDQIKETRLSRMKFVWDHLMRPEVEHRETPALQRGAFALATLFSPADPYWTIPEYLALERSYGFTATYFLQASGRGNGAPYDLDEPRMKMFIDDVRTSGFEVGLHSTYRAPYDEARFRQEMANLAAALGGEALLGQRSHYLRLEYSLTLPILERAGLMYDATLGYAECDGYRNHFSYPYQPYDHAEDRPFGFWELPTVIMDVSLAGYRHLPAAQAWTTIEDWLVYACAWRGCVTLLWHNVWDGVYPGYFNLYPRILAWIAERGGIGLSGRDVIGLWLRR